MAEAHVADCSSCRTQLAEERALKAAIHRSVITRTPADLQLRIRAAMGDMPEPYSGTSRGIRSFRARFAGGSRDGVSAIARRAALIRNPLVAASIAAAILMIVILFPRGNTGPVTSSPAIHPADVFDKALTKFETMRRDFQPNVPDQVFSHSDGPYYAWVVSRSSPVRPTADRLDISRAYQELNMPQDLFDFDAAGYRLFGGRFESFDGKPATYTLYRSPDADIMEIWLTKELRTAPTGSVYWIGEHSFYHYKDHSFCVTIMPGSDTASVVVTEAPLVELVRDVAISDMLASAQ